MITSRELDRARQRAARMVDDAGIITHEYERLKIDVADFGLSELEASGVQILTLLDTNLIAVKILISFPQQTEPEHSHPALPDGPGKQETIRCEWGELYLYSPGEPTPNPKAHPPSHRIKTYTVWHENILLPGDQITFQPNTPHWFQGGPEGCVFWSFSSKVTDLNDVFTDPDVIRETIIVDDSGN